MKTQETINVYMCDAYIAEKLITVFDQSPSLFGKPKIKIFSGREWFLFVSDDEIEPKPKVDEKMDYIFMTAESLKKYYYHPVYRLDLKKVMEKYGTKNTKAVIFSCCSDCNGFVRSTYGDIITEFLSIDSYVKDIVKKYFADCLVVN